MFERKFVVTLNGMECREFQTEQKAIDFVEDSAETEEVVGGKIYNQCDELLTTIINVAS